MAVFDRAWAIILAGGLSRRMGEDKAAVLVDGRPMLALVVDQMEALGLAGIVVGCGPPERVAGYSRILGGRGPPRRSTVRLEPDATPRGGPLRGLVDVWPAVPSDATALIVRPVDAPWVDRTVYAMLMDRLGDHEAAIPVYEGRAEALFGVYRPGAGPRLANALAMGIDAPREAIRGLDSVLVDMSASPLTPGLQRNFRDVDTRGDI
ncbi:MAG: molybdenum cofactor guanylyltransferase [Thermoplasmatota archaeon]